MRQSVIHVTLRVDIVLTQHYLQQQKETRSSVSPFPSKMCTLWLYSCLKTTLHLGIYAFLEIFCIRCHSMYIKYILRSECSSLYLFSFWVVSPGNHWSTRLTHKMLRNVHFTKNINNALHHHYNVDHIK